MNIAFSVTEAGSDLFNTGFYAQADAGTDGVSPIYSCARTG